MIADRIEHADRYATVYPRLEQAFNYLRTTDLANVAPGKYAIDGDNVFAIVQEYTTMDTANEQMEAHRKHIDVQHMISGREQVGLALYNGQTTSKAYDEGEDFMLYSDKPSFFATLESGCFMVFFPTDLHMPCIKLDEPEQVKKVVVKVKI